MGLNMTYSDLQDRLINIVNNNTGKIPEFDYEIPIANGFIYHKSKEITLGFGNPDEPYIQRHIDPHEKIKPHTIPDNKVIPDINATLCIIGAFHESAHYTQITDKYQQENVDDLTYLGALDMACSKVSGTYYDRNYTIMAHEVDAEKTALINTFGYLQDEFGLSEVDAEKCIVDAVNTKSTFYYDLELKENVRNSYFVHPFNSYSSFKEIMNAYTVKEQDLFKIPRLLQDFMTNDKKDDRILRQVSKQSPFWAIKDLKSSDNTYGPNDDPLAHAERIMQAAIKISPNLESEFKAIESKDIPHKDLGVRTFLLHQPLIDRIKAKIDKNASNVFNSKAATSSEKTDESDKGIV